MAGRIAWEGRPPVSVKLCIEGYEEIGRSVVSAQGAAPRGRIDASVHSPEPRRDVVAVLEKLAGALAGVAALVYLTGGLALQLRLGTVRLPSSAAVPQLPREFLISQGLLIVAPAIALALVAGWAVRARGRSRSEYLAAGIATGLACYLAIGWLVVGKDPFPAKVCLQGGDEVVGVFIGETDSRTYLGDLSSAHPRRIVSIPQSQVARVVVGGRERQLGEVRCGGSER